jgi:hypothetical protein
MHDAWRQTSSHLDHCGLKTLLAVQHSVSRASFATQPRVCPRGRHKSWLYALERNHPPPILLSHRFLHVEPRYHPDVRYGCSRYWRWTGRSYVGFGARSRWHPRPDYRQGGEPRAVRPGGRYVVCVDPSYPILNRLQASCHAPWRSSRYVKIVSLRYQSLDGVAELRTTQSHIGSGKSESRHCQYRLSIQRGLALRLTRREGPIRSGSQWPHGALLECPPVIPLTAIRGLAVSQASALSTPNIPSSCVVMGSMRKDVELRSTQGHSEPGRH